MANSDNVVRAGLTPKFKDVEVLTDMLTFETGNNWLFSGIPSDGGRMTFYPPIPDFAIERIEVEFRVNRRKCFIFVFKLENIF
jgi:mannose-6-phosphate isomerase